ncbi:MAG TPA: YlxR family protein [Solirubrobacteraceae bacterium]|nr:YlxR family protein [Solirubrobacteraceae bacterium]
MPRRTCVGCGRIAAKGELVRLAAARRYDAAGPLAVIDDSGTMPGRGAYLCRSDVAPHPAAECLARALRRGALARTLRAPVTLDPKIVESMSR